MSVDTTVAAWETWLAAQSTPISGPTRYKHAPPWPFSGGYPYVIITPQTQHLMRYSNAEVRWEGYWRLIYVDAVGANYSSVDQILEAAGAWAEAVRTALQSSELSRSLLGAVDYAGESNDGGGFSVAWSDKETGLDVNEVPYWALPVDVYVRELPVLG